MEPDNNRCVSFRAPVRQPPGMTGLPKGSETLLKSRLKARLLISFWEAMLSRTKEYWDDESDVGGEIPRMPKGMS
jgi:hypothetical protein